MSTPVIVTDGAGTTYGTALNPLNVTSVVGGNLRKIASGNTNVGAGATVTLTTKTAQANEAFLWVVACSDAVAGVQINGPSATTLAPYLESTGVARQQALKVKNNDGANARNVDWELWGLS